MSAVLKWQIQKIHLKVIFSLPLPDVSKIYDLCVRSRPIFKAIMNYISRDIITQESWTNASWFKFYNFPPSGSNFCVCILPEMEKESVLQNAGGGIMLIKALVQWLETVPLKEAFIRHTGLQSRYFGGQQSAWRARLTERGNRSTGHSGARPPWQRPCCVIWISDLLYPPTNSLGFKKGFAKIVLLSEVGTIN